MKNVENKQIKPTKEEILKTQKNVMCTQEGCKQTFFHNGSLTMHLVKSHGQINNEAEKRLFHRGKTRNKVDFVLQFKCPEEKCPYGYKTDKHFSTFSNLKQHYQKVHAEKPYECSKCEKSYARECDLQRHEPVCGKMYKCGSCQVQYRTTEALITHCKRQDHTYPEEFRRKEKQKPTNNKSGVRNIATIALIPVMVVTAPAERPKPIPPKELKPKHCPESMPKEDLFHNDDIIHESSNPVARQDVLIQTDIFGVNNISVSDRQNLYEQTNSCINTNQSNYLNPSQKRSTSGKIISPPKKSPAAKRKLGLDKYANPSSPRRKKMKLSTGMQTSISSTRKPSGHTVSGTQTTGDYILKTAMAQANIQIERKTVASQVTPRKPNQLLVRHKEKCTIETQTLSPVDNSGMQEGNFHRPVLVDSYSQVKQRNIWAETSHNLAESQTMTDLPPSISTQTLQSYLVNQQERQLSKKHLNKDKVLVHGYHRTFEDNPHATFEDVQTTSTGESSVATSEIERDNIVEIYSSNLASSVSFVAPLKVRQKRSWRQRQSYCNNQESEIDKHQTIQQNVNSPKTITLPCNKMDVLNKVQSEAIESVLPHDTDFLETIHLSPQSYSRETISVQCSPSDCVGDLGEARAADVSSTYVDKAGSCVTDTEAHAMMSADEFESLLRSNGIFLDSYNKIDKKSSQNMPSSSSQHTSYSDKQLGPNFDFLHCDANTADINTQTGGDMSFFEHYGSIDTNTQTVGEMDFLDMVMTNMETQTLSEEDLIDLGLSSLNANTATQTLGVDKPDCSWIGQHHSTSHYCSTGSGSSVDSYSKPFHDSDHFSSYNQSKFCENQANQSTTNSLPLDDKVTSQSQTQTVAIDATEPLFQTETQTQVELPGLETMNMETQTTFEDLQQICDWFG